MIQRRASLSEPETEIALGFHALSEPIRLQVLEHLKIQELCVCDLCDRLELSPSKLSFHLKTLRQAGLVQSRQQGRWVYYSLNIPQFQILEGYLNQYRSLDAIRPAQPCSP
ncbi:metalloregulator ArsR/SmtB family transcription factor [Candidatus Synechococcus calcipolaris G9]|uniref:Metalloregulator ArsR/SmtB family transcription factor n=1 Tax=Candidatus Synechococcus calcipolaris G9 TaxID=1497997 RepID=A0ABT6EZC3_9SYNE|nr:metalloregulator ArsR/SmtB family transcription factor [Candidatus Synechococcus calcipolaris]MDG2990955.1 metalloregulator ArsR/SmtB family transcription factor [Candidatus Synechococcus calcipolaris G9]